MITGGLEKDCIGADDCAFANPQDTFLAEHLTPWTEDDVIPNFNRLEFR